MNIPDAAIEAAAEAIARLRPRGEDVQARAAIEAALPAIREHIAQEVEAGIRRTRTGGIITNYDEGRAEAARIVRGGAA